MSFRSAILAMTAGALLISSSGAWVRAADVAPSISGFYRMAIGGLVLLVVCVLKRESVRPQLRHVGWLLMPALFFTLDLFFWHKSILLVGPGLAAILANLQVFVLATVGIIWLGEHLSARFIAGLILAGAGVWLLVGEVWHTAGGQFRLGVGFGLATALAYSLYLLSLRRTQTLTRGLSPMAVLALTSLLCAGLLGVVARGENASFAIPDLASALALLANGVLVQVLGWLLITRSIAWLPASLVGLILLAEPGLSFVWDVLFFDRSVLRWDLPGLALVLAGIYIAAINRRGRSA